MSTTTTLKRKFQKVKENSKEEEEEEKDIEPVNKKQKLEPFDCQNIVLNIQKHVAVLSFWTNVSNIDEYECQLVQLPCFNWDGTQYSPLTVIKPEFFLQIIDHQYDEFNFKVFTTLDEKVPILLRVYNQNKKILFQSKFLNDQTELQASSFDSICRETDCFRTFLGSTPISNQLLKSIKDYKSSTSLPDCIQQVHHNDSPVKYVLKPSKTTEIVKVFVIDIETETYFCECENSNLTLDNVLLQQQCFFQNWNIYKLKKYLSFNPETRILSMQNSKMFMTDCEYKKSISLEIEQHNITVVIKPQQLYNYQSEKQIIVKYIQISDLVDIITDYWNPEILILNLSIPMNQIFTFCENKFLHQGIYGQDLLFSNNRSFRVMTEVDLTEFDQELTKTKNNMTIFVKTLSGQVRLLSVEKSCTIKQLKEKIAKKFEKCTDTIRLNFNGNALPDSATLEEKNIVHHSTIFVLFQMGGS
jgi:hypothetical protein